MDDLPQHVAAAMTKQTELELVQRSTSGVAVYVLVSFVLWASTPYRHEHPAVLHATIAAFLVLAVWRVVGALLVRTHYDDAPRFWQANFRAGVTASAAVGGALFGVTVVFYAWEWTAMLLATIMSAFVAGAASSLAPDARLARRYVALLFVPTITYCLLDGRTESLAMGALLSLNVAYHLTQVGKQHAWYWRALRDNALLTRQTTQLGDARRAAEAANAAKSDFLANMSHEVRTPIHIVYGMLDMVADEGGLSENQADALSRARSAASALLQLINDVLDVSKIEAGKVEIESLPFDVRDTVTSVVDLFVPPATAKGVALRCHLPEGLPRRHLGDAHRLRQILTNLVGNAVKFTECGSIDVEVGFAPMDGDADAVTIGVRDTGIGIPLERHAAVLEPFTQADGTMSRSYGGTGLGLTIARRLVGLMGGTLQFESEPGRGSRFWFEVTLLRPAHGADGPAPLRATGGARL